MILGGRRENIKCTWFENPGRVSMRFFWGGYTRVVKILGVGYTFFGFY
jgi:hypothetical protein